MHSGADTLLWVTLRVLVFSLKWRILRLCPTCLSRNRWKRFEFHLNVPCCRRWWFILFLLFGTRLNPFWCVSWQDGRGTLCVSIYTPFAFSPDTIAFSKWFKSFACTTWHKLLIIWWGYACKLTWTRIRISRNSILLYIRNRITNWDSVITGTSLLCIRIQETGLDCWFPESLTLLIVC